MIIDRTNAVMTQLKGWADDGLDAFADIFVEKAKTRAPVDTGNLKSSIGKDKDAEGVFVATGVQGDCGYGAYPEMGTSKMQAQPFLAPGFEEARKDFKPEGIN